MTEDHAKLFMKAGFRSKKGFLYSNNDSHMLAALVERVTGKHLDDYLDEKLFSKIGIKKPHWDKNKIGVSVGGSGIFWTCSDLAKVGQCVADGGKWNGEQVIPEDYIKTAVKKHVDVPKRYHADGFGYYFWQDGETYRLEGLFGQFAIVVPNKEAVVTITSMHPSDNIVAKTVQDDLIANLFKDDDKDYSAELEEYLKARDKRIVPIKNQRDRDTETSLKNKEFKRIGIITDITYSMTKFQNCLIANAIHSSYPDRPKKSFDDFSFEFKENELDISWVEDNVKVSFTSGLDGKWKVKR